MPDPSWDILNDACTSLSGWTTANTGDGAISTVTEDGRSCFRFTSSSGQAHMGKFVSSFTDFTLELVIKLASTGSDSAPSSFYIYTIDNGIYYNQMSFSEHVTLGNAKARYDIAGYSGYTIINYWIDATSSTWITARIVCTGSGGNIHSFNDGQYFDYIGLTGSNPSASANQVGIGTVNNGRSTTIYVDQIKMSGTQEEATQVSPLKVQGETVAPRLSSQGYNGVKFTSDRFDDPVRFVYGGGVKSSYLPYCLPYVSTSHPSKTGLRVYDNSGTYSFLGWPALP